MKKEELLNRITNNDGNTRITSISSREEGEEIIALAKHLEYEGKITLMEYCLESKPLAVSLKADSIK
ncbi:hypothetical protein RCG23_09140 [Neobacillus sp. PS3-34]|uniref:hypothetical protein n=1 Tax=Neobacillus sp. PS3-34 TaxID=3070678 RepID=UPI0027E00F96|nr:hypothetical protein [Neobacillus sp. PS3-34]WML49991.1 hypothetical protein RCG23_09140 [Neobacillus sp. PS3-34]